MKLAIKFAFLATTIVVAGCQSTDGTGQSRLNTLPSVEDQYVATDEPQRLGREHFKRGNYALAERYFQAAVEQTPQDGDSWVGLAASYDQLSRFDLADRAYDQAVKIKGNTPQLMNNRGFSYLLRGDAARARSLFGQALSESPENVTINNNLTILRQTQAIR